MNKEHSIFTRVLDYKYGTRSFFLNGIKINEKIGCPYSYLYKKYMLLGVDFSDIEIGDEIYLSIKIKIK